MQPIKEKFSLASAGRVLLCLVLFTPPAMALESDRQKTLEVFAENSDGFLNDGITTLSGNVDIRQGTLHITANKAEINKVDGRIKSVIFHGQPVFLEQDIEEEGHVEATASVMDYQVAGGLVTLTGAADVKHPQYQISGDVLIYDLNIQHFRGLSDESGNGRIHIRIDPEVIDGGLDEKPGAEESPAVDQAAGEAAGETAGQDAAEDES